MSKTLPPANLVAVGFSSGQKIYVKFYGKSFWSNKYEDITSGKKVGPNLNKSTANSNAFLMS